MRETESNHSSLFAWLTLLLIAGTALTGWLFFLHVREKQLRDEHFNIIAIVQRAKGQDALKTAALAELLSLSLDRPTNLYPFDTGEAEQKLLQQPYILAAKVKKIPPGILDIDYQLRSPIAFLGEMNNTAVDNEGFLFPYDPIYTPKRLPAITLGLSVEECQWGRSVKEHPSFDKALQLVRLWNDTFDHQLHIKQLDMSLERAESLGKRQITVIAEWKNKKTCILRLSTQHTESDLSHLCTLLHALDKKEDAIKDKTIIDLRLNDLAFFEPAITTHLRE